MLTVLRKIRKSLIDSGSARKYLLYAVGEILLVMIGILLALQVNTWNQNRVNRIKEVNALNLLQENLKDQSHQIRLAHRLSRNRIKYAFDVFDYLEHNTTFHDSMRAHIRYATTDDRTYVINSGFEIIKNTKLSNDELERMIHDLYEGQLRRIDVGTSYAPDIGTYFEDYARKHFNAVDISISAAHPELDSLGYKERVQYIIEKNWGRRHFGYAPKDYNHLRQDEEFQLLLKKSIEFRTWKIMRIQSAIKAIDEIQEVLEKEIISLKKAN